MKGNEIFAKQNCSENAFSRIVNKFSARCAERWKVRPNFLRNQRAGEIRHHRGEVH